MRGEYVGVRKVSKSYLVGLASGLLISLVVTVIISSIILRETTLGSYISSLYRNSKRVSDVLTEVEELVLSVRGNKIEGYTAITSEVVNGYIKNIGDKWGAYMDPSEVGNYIQTEGEYSGIGVITLWNDKGYFEVTRVIDGSPASVGGIEIGDKIIKIDGKEVCKDDTLRGKTETKVLIGIKKGISGKELEVEAVRGNVEYHTVETSIEGNTGTVRVWGMDTETEKLFFEGLEKIKDCDKKVLDLRGNSGGSIDVTISILEKVVHTGEIFLTEDRVDEEEDTVRVGTGIMEYGDIDMILVDRNTASSSEVMAQVYKEQFGCKVLGESTVGKGAILDHYILSNGGYLWITSGDICTREGRSLSGVGVEIDEYYKEVK